MKRFPNKHGVNIILALVGSLILRAFTIHETTEVETVTFPSIGLDSISNDESGNRNDKSLEKESKQNKGAQKTLKMKRKPKRIAGYRKELSNVVIDGLRPLEVPRLPRKEFTCEGSNGQITYPRHQHSLLQVRKRVGHQLFTIYLRVTLISSRIIIWKVTILTTERTLMKHSHTHLN